MFEEQRIVQRIEAAARAAGVAADDARDVAFHMTDWLDDLERWVAFCKDPDAIDAEALGDLLSTFLIHVPQHVAAAAKLYTGDPVTDVFNVGATSPDQFVSAE